MEQLNNRQTELFWELLANPADKSYSHVQNLRQLAAEYPQSGLLQSLLLYAGEDDSLNHAAVYSDPRLLYKMRNNADALHTVTDAQVVKVAGEKKYFHTDGGIDTLKDDVEITSLYPETAGAPFTEEELRHEAPADEYKPAEHFFEPETQPGEEPVADQHNEEPLGYEDEIVPGIHESQNIIEEPYAHNIGETEDEDIIPHTPAESIAEEFIPQSGETQTSYDQQPEAETVQEPQIKQEISLEDTKREPQIIQEIPLEEIKQEPQFEQEIELPTPGFFVPGAASHDTGTYQGDSEDLYNRLYESYAETFEHKTSQPIEEEVYNEIIGIDDINLASQVFAAPKDDVPQSPQPIDEMDEPVLGFQSAPANPVSISKGEQAFRDRKVDLNDEAEKLMLSNIAATDFFVFDKALSERIKAGDEPKQEPVPIGDAAPQTTPGINSPSAKKHTYERVTKYFDEKMPYSFMWWLDKTRKEHSGIYQPFVEFKLDTSQKIEKDVPDELQQQYYENIFELTSVDELERTTGTEPVKFDPRKKEDEIIERFIHETPQIKPQTSDKLDNENKAKRSSEDQDEIVTETLAQVYTDQMLYHKAIKVYQKLMLKFPEKRRYFAGQIEELEKKII